MGLVVNVSIQVNSTLSSPGAASSLFVLALTISYKHRGQLVIGNKLLKQQLPARVQSSVSPEEPVTFQPLLPEHSCHSK